MDIYPESGLGDSFSTSRAKPEPDNGQQQDVSHQTHTNPEPGPGDSSTSSRAESEPDNDQQPVRKFIVSNTVFALTCSNL
jgi:hypothetical protein